MVAGNEKALVQVQAMRRMSMVTRIERDHLIALRAGEIRYIIEQHAAVTFASCFRQRTQVVDVKMFTTIKELEIPEADHGSRFIIFLDECELVPFFHHVLHQWNKGFRRDMRTQFEHCAGAFRDVFGSLSELNGHV